MNIWWVNQSEWYKKEKNGSCIFASESKHPNRKLVLKAKQGDLIIHYAKSHIRAVSQIKTDGAKSFNDVHEKEGWNCKTEYYEFKNPIHRNLINQRILELEIEGGPIHDSPNVRGNVRRGYFFRFNREGLHIIQEISKTDWPEWAK